MKSLNERRDELALEQSEFCHCAGYTCSGCEKKTIALYSMAFDAAVNELLPQIEKLVEALEMGAFHHSACDANLYSEETKENWDGHGDHRKARPCTCAHAKVDLALAEWRKFKGE